MIYRIGMLKTEAIKFFDGTVKLAAACGVSRQAVHAWPEVVPDNYQYRLHYLSDGFLLLSDHLKKPPPNRYASDPPGVQP